MEKKFISCILTHALGDCIGYKNGEWEFMYSIDKIWEFIALGGVNELDLDGWKVSDDTILHMKTAQGLLSSFTGVNTLATNTLSYYIDALEQFEKEGFSVRTPGNTTINSLTILKNDHDTKWDKLEYNFMSGGSGAAMRTAVIGLAFYGKHNRSKLVQISIELSRITHNSVIGYLGGLTSALFTAYALEEIPVKKWPFLLLELLESDIIDNAIKNSGRGYNNYQQDKHIFINKWHRYIKDKFDDDKNVIVRKSSSHLGMRSKYYEDNFGFNPEIHNFNVGGKNTQQKIFIGSGGDDSVLISYDCLLDSGKSWEKLIFYAMLHKGDTDTTGCIAGAWYGTLYGMDRIPDITIKNLEYKKELEKLGKEIFNKFCKNI